MLLSDPAIVAEARKMAAEQLEEWGLDEMVFTTELVVSELVTNAIRYAGGGPIQLRLIRDTTLITEVSDANSTAPHLRRGPLFDEGGRGLLLVASHPVLGHPADPRRKDHLGRAGALLTLCQCRHVLWFRPPADAWPSWLP